MSVLNKLHYLLETEVPSERIVIHVKDEDDESESVLKALEKLEQVVDEVEVDVGKEDNRFDYEYGSERGIAGSVDDKIIDDYDVVEFEVKMGDGDVESYVKDYIAPDLPGKHLSYGEYDEIEFDLRPVVTIEKKISDNHAIFRVDWDFK